MEEIVLGFEQEMAGIVVAVPVLNPEGPTLDIAF